MTNLTAACASLLDFTINNVKDPGLNDSDGSSAGEPDDEVPVGLEIGGAQTVRFALAGNLSTGLSGTGQALFSVLFTDASAKPHLKAPAAPIPWGFQPSPSSLSGAAVG
ncbi:hypothetical protein [Azospirillum doebereinerae]